MSAVHLRAPPTHSGSFQDITPLWSNPSNISHMYSFYLLKTYSLIFTIILLCFCLFAFQLCFCCYIPIYLPHHPVYTLRFSVQTHYSTLTSRANWSLPLQLFPKAGLLYLETWICTRPHLPFVLLFLLLFFCCRYYYFLAFWHCKPALTRIPFVLY